LADIRVSPYSRPWLCPLNRAQPIQNTGPNPRAGPGDRRAKAITTCGTEITKPGDYYLANDLLGCTGDGLIIRSSKVDVDLNGHVITAGGPRTGVGIRIPGGINGVHSIEIKGPGVLHGFDVFPGTGMALENVRRSEFRGITITNNFFGLGVNRFFDSSGAVFGTESMFNTFSRLQILGNTGHGVTSNGGNKNLYVRNLLFRNGDCGILLFDAVGNRVERNVAIQNSFGINTVNGIGLDNDITALSSTSGIDLLDENPNCDGNTWRDNVGVGNRACVE
jgi:parallel beta-helix repeat protein